MTSLIAQQNPVLCGALGSPKSHKRTGRVSSVNISCTFTPSHSHRGHGKDKSPAPGGHLQRVSAIAMDAPASLKDEDQLRAQLTDQQARLTKMYFTTTDYEQRDLESSTFWQSKEDEEDEDTEPLEQENSLLARLERQRGSLQASTSAPEVHITTSTYVPSTRTSLRRGRRVSRAKSSLTSKASLGRGSSALFNSVERYGELATHYLTQLAEETGGPSDPDFEFLLEMRAWLQSGRQKRRQKACQDRNTISMFLGSLGHTPVLTGVQERQLATITMQGTSIRSIAKKLTTTLGRVPELSEIAEAAGLSSAGEAALKLALADEASDLMVQFNLRMVFSIAKRYANKGVELADLIPEGVVGLRKAIEKFDATKGFKFSTYAHWWIRQAVSRSVSDHGRVVRVPIHIVEFLLKVKKVRKELKSQPGRTTPPTYREMARALGIPVQKLVTLLNCAKEPRTPEESLGASDNSSSKAGPDAADELWLDEFEGNGNPIEESEKEEYLRDTLNVMLSTLPKRERNILRLRYGLFPNMRSLTGELASSSASEFATLSSPSSPSSWDESSFNNWEESGMNLQEVGVTYNLSRERIRQIEEKAMQQLRQPWRKGMLTRVKDGRPLDYSEPHVIKYATALRNPL